MNIGTFNTDKDVLIIAEIGNNHEGDFDQAVRLIHLAAKAGAHAVKFQTFRTELYVSPKDQARFRRLKSFEFTFEQFTHLAKVARETGVLFLSTPFDLESARFLEPHVAAYKIASGDNNFFPLLEQLARTGKPLIMSGGLANQAQLTYSKAFIDNIWAERSLAPGLAILHCVTSYPVPPAEANLLAIPTLRKTLGGVIGYSDHTLGIEATVMAVTLGARIIEKHFTSDKRFSDFRDHQISADPEEFALMVKRVRETRVLLGDGCKIPQPGENSIISAVRRSIVARRPIAVGTHLVLDDLTWIRPGGGLAPGQEALVLGRKVKAYLQPGDPLLLEDLES